MATTKLSQSSANASRRGTMHELVEQFNAKGNCVLKDPGLTIKAGGSAVVKAANAFYAVADGVLLTKAANTDMAALAGTVTADNFGVWFFYVDSAGTLTTETLTQAASLAAITFPTFPSDKAIVGAALVNPTGTGDFVGGTTALDDATVVPNAVYFDGNDFGGVLGNVLSFRSTGTP